MFPSSCSQIFLVGKKLSGKFNSTSVFKLRYSAKKVQRSFGEHECITSGGLSCLCSLRTSKYWWSKPWASRHRHGGDFAALKDMCILSGQERRVKRRYGTLHCTKAAADSIMTYCVHVLAADTITYESRPWRTARCNTKECIVPHCAGQPTPSSAVTPGYRQQTNKYERKGSFDLGSVWQLGNTGST